MGGRGVFCQWGEAVSELAERGYSEEDLYQIGVGNWMRVLEETWLE